MPSRKDMLLQMLQGGLEKGLGIGAAGAKQSMEHDSDLAKLARQAELEKPYKDADSDYKNRMANVAQQQANTMEEYRKDQMRISKLKELLGGGGGDKPLSGEMQKTSNLIDAGRQSLNSTEDLLKQHPIAGALEQITPGFVSSKVGGPLKKIADSRANTKEAMQSVYTGAAASGEQVPAFQAFSGPGIMDILSGNVDTSQPIRDAMNTLQQGYKKQKRVMSPEMLKASGMENDPLAQQALQQQQASADSEMQRRLSMLSPGDQEIFKAIQAEPNHPNSAAHKQRLVRRYGNIF